MDVCRVKYKWYDPELGYGFFRVLDDQGHETGEDVYFRPEFGRFVTTQNHKPEFAGNTVIIDGVSTKLPLPNAGTEVVFVREPSDNGADKARPWTHKEYWTQETRPPVQRSCRIDNIKRHSFFPSRKSRVPSAG